MGPAEVRETESSLVVLATGSTWRRDGVGRHFTKPISVAQSARVLTPDDIMAGAKVAGHVVIYDDDHFYMGSVVAEALVAAGCTVTIVTPAAQFAGFTQLSLEIRHIQKRMAELGVAVMPLSAVEDIAQDHVRVSDVFGQSSRDLPCDTVVMVAGQQPNNELFHQLAQADGPQRVVAIGDCQAPATIASAIFAGHKFARDLGLADPDVAPFLREDVALSPNTTGWNAIDLQRAAE
jgi:dimethylamine/trimethylamine dehydrogenase